MIIGNHCKSANGLTMFLILDGPPLEQDVTCMHLPPSGMEQFYIIMSNFIKSSAHLQVVPNHENKSEN